MTDLAGWESFYVVAGGAAAALTGLIFVAVSLHGRAIMDNPLHRDRAWSSVALLATQLLIALAALFPSQSRAWFGAEISPIAVFWLVRTIRVTKVLGSAMRRQDRPNAYWQVEWATWIAWLIALVAGAIALIAGYTIGLLLVAFAMIGMFAFAIWNAWVLISEVSE